MRTNVTTVVTINSVFGYGQDRVVSLVGESCACAAQHLDSRHAKQDRAWASALKRMWLMAAAAFGPAPLATLTRVAITGPRRLRERLRSPELVLA